MLFHIYLASVTIVAFAQPFLVDGYETTVNWRFP